MPPSRSVQSTKPSRFDGASETLDFDLIHHAYPTLESYLEHMDRYSSLGARLLLEQHRTGGSWLSFHWNVFVIPTFEFFRNYLLRFGFLDGREGLLLHLYHSAYVSWKYAKCWELARQASQDHPASTPDRANVPCRRAPPPRLSSHQHPGTVSGLGLLDRIYLAVHSRRSAPSSTARRNAVWYRSGSARFFMSRPTTTCVVSPGTQQHRIR